MEKQEQNKRTALRWLDLISQHRIDAICEMTAPTWRMHGGPPGLPMGPLGVRELFRTIGPVRQTWNIDIVLADGDMVAVRATNTCYQEQFLGIAAEGRRQTFTATFIHRIARGRILETWRNADNLGRVLQLGARIEPAIREQSQSIAS